MKDDSVRLDKWLWAARFFKTRPLATEAVTGGKVHLNGNRVKPGRNLSVGDALCIQRNGFIYDIRVLGINDKRRPASDAQLLYEESVDSKQAREKLLETHRLVAGTRPRTTRRPNKHERRHIVRFKRKQ